ncbi:MAG TPA: methyltransferase domain-containing protein [Solirubrobacteraceae bacterium]|nr:methyltransferase domain-containing protein [Solirubrobacteraceae bacterium]
MQSADAHVIEELLALPCGELRLLRPRDAEALLDEHAFEADEFLPYWAELWPSGVALARKVGARAWHGARVLELGCGLGTVSIAAALAGARVLATDWSSEAVRFAAENAKRSGAAIETLVCDWSRAQALVDRAPWDAVLASDVLYERRNGEVLLELLPRLVGERGEVLLADPERATAADFVAAAAVRFEVGSTVLSSAPRVSLHRLRLRGGAGGPS